MKSRIPAIEIERLRMQFYSQLPVVAAICAVKQDHIMDFDEAVEDALDLIDTAIDAVIAEIEE